MTTNQKLDVRVLVWANSITGEPFRTLLLACEESPSTQAKKALRAYIDILEGLYNGM